MNRAVNISNSSQLAIHRNNPTERLLQKEPSSTSSDEFAEKVARAQSQLEDLQQRQQEIETEKNELESLWSKQSDFQASRAEIIHDLQQALEVIERNYLQSEQRIESYTRTRECFSHHLSAISAIRSEEWQREQLDVEIDGAKITIEEARSEYDRALANLNRLNSGVEEIPGTSASHDEGAGDKTAIPQRNFIYWLRSGFAFSLPIMIFGSLLMTFLLIFN